MPQPRKRAQPKNKEELAALLQHKEVIDKQRKVARSVFPLIEGLPKIYDAQTAFHAASGFLKQELAIKEEALKVSDLPIDLSREPKGPMKDAVQAIIDAVQNEPAAQASETLKIMGDKLSTHIAAKGLMQPMDTLKMDDFIA